MEAEGSWHFTKLGPLHYHKVVVLANGAIWFKDSIYLNTDSLFSPSFVFNAFPLFWAIIKNIVFDSDFVKGKAFNSQKGMKWFPNFLQVFDFHVHIK